MSGHLVLVVGPSGAGKDSLINAARVKFADDSTYFFPRRIITRQAMQAAEDHDSIDPEVFLKIEKQGGFFLHWQAHGLHYALPAATADALRTKHVVIANVSRTVLVEAAKLWPHTTVIMVTAPAEILAARVAARSRREDGDIQKRIARSVDPMPPGLPVVTITNDGALEKATAEFCNLIEALNRD